MTKFFSDRGFTLIELMITVAIIGVLAAVAIPAYQNYIRRSYLSEATSSISAIKSAEESYFSINNCYVSAGAHPAPIPAGGISVAWDAAPWPAATGLAGNAWTTTALGVRPDRTVRFQYQVYAGNNIQASGACQAGVAVNAKPVAGAAVPTTCIANTTTTLIPDGIFDPALGNWYLVVARGDLTLGGATSSIISAIDDSKVIMCNELE